MRYIVDVDVSLGLNKYIVIDTLLGLRVGKATALITLAQRRAAELNVMAHAGE